ncbi:calcium-binding protein [Malaciobacter mytili]|uniref:calcium-binding protein n=1 Tax=Malaciobacter mytili TaxID=603050 RepID=UPI003A85BB00
MAKNDEIVKYLNKKVQIKGKPQSGENIAVYVRPGDKIDLEDANLNLDDVSYKLIGGDIILEFPDGGVYTFVSMALMGYNDTPPTLSIGGKTMTLGNILSEIEEVNNLPLEAVLANEDLDIPPSSTQEVEKLEDVTEKNTNTNPPVIITEVQLEENEFTSDNELEKALDAEIPPEIPEPQEPPILGEPPKKDGTPQKEDEVNDASPLKFEFSIDMQHVLQSVDESIQGTGADAKRVLTVQGGGGTYYENIYPNSNVSANASEIKKQTNAEEMSYKTADINKYDSVVINSDNSEYFGDNYTSRTIKLSPIQGAGFAIEKVWISSDDLPAGFKVHNAAQSGNSWLLVKDNPDTDEVEGFTIDAKGNINITMNTNVDKNFVLNIKAQTVFDINNIDENLRGDVQTPSKTTEEFDLTVGVNLKKINDITDPSEYKYQEIDNDEIDKVNGQSEQTGFVISSNINDTVLYGSTNLKNTINGGTVNDTIYAGLNDDTIYGNSGNDTIRAYAGNDTIEGGTGDDWIASGLGNDIVNGNEGIDTIDFSHIDSVNPEGVVVVLDQDLEDGIYGTATGIDGNDELRSIENVIGSN